MDNPCCEEDVDETDLSDLRKRERITMSHASFEPHAAMISKDVPSDSTVNPT